MTFAWTDEVEDRARRMWNAGLSAKAVARAVGAPAAAAIGAPDGGVWCLRERDHAEPRLVRQSPFDPYERIAELEEEVAFYKAELGLEADNSRVACLCLALRITPAQALMILLLMARAPNVVSKGALHAALYGGREAETLTKIVDVHVCHARRRMGAGLIQTVWGLGYALTDEGARLVRAALEGMG